jgi:hypothetical protein
VTKFQIRRFLLGLAMWELVVFAPILGQVALRGGQIYLEDATLLVPVFLFGVILVLICSTIAARFRGATAAAIGFLAGTILALGGGILWASQATGFERRSGIFIGTLYLTIPSGIGGALVGWLNRRRL